MLEININNVLKKFTPSKIVENLSTKYTSINEYGFIVIDELRKKDLRIDITAYLLKLLDEEIKHASEEAKGK